MSRHRLGRARTLRPTQVAIAATLVLALTVGAWAVNPPGNLPVSPGPLYDNGRCVKPQ